MDDSLIDNSLYHPLSRFHNESLQHPQDRDQQDQDSVLFTRSLSKYSIDSSSSLCDNPNQPKSFFSDDDTESEYESEDSETDSDETVTPSHSSDAIEVPFTFKKTVLEPIFEEDESSASADNHTEDSPSSSLETSNAVTSSFIPGPPPPSPTALPSDDEIDYAFAGSLVPTRKAPTPPAVSNLKACRRPGVIIRPIYSSPITRSSKSKIANDDSEEEQASLLLLQSTTIGDDLQLELASDNQPSTPPRSAPLLLAVESTISSDDVCAKSTRLLKERGDDLEATPTKKTYRSEASAHSAAGAFSVHIADVERSEKTQKRRSSEIFF